MGTSRSRDYLQNRPAMLRRAAHARAAERQRARAEVYMTELGDYVTPDELAAAPEDMRDRLDAANQHVADIMTELKQAESDRTTARRVLARAINTARAAGNHVHVTASVDNIFLVLP